MLSWGARSPFIHECLLYGRDTSHEPHATYQAAIGARCLPDSYHRLYQDIVLCICHVLAVAAVLVWLRLLERRSRWIGDPATRLAGLT